MNFPHWSPPRLQIFFMFPLFSLLCYYFPPFSPRSLEKSRVCGSFLLSAACQRLKRKEKKRSKTESLAIIIFMLLCVFLFCYILGDAAALRLCWSHCLSLALAPAGVGGTCSELLFLLLLELFIHSSLFCSTYWRTSRWSCACVGSRSFGVKVV